MNGERSGPTRGALAWIATAVAWTLCGCTTAPIGDPNDAPGSVTEAPVALGDRSHDGHWYLPSGAAAALVVLEPGFAQPCRRLRGTARELMQAGLMVLCVDAEMTAGNPALADALARSLISDLTAPGLRALPQRIIVAGHSAGGAFAAQLGVALIRLAAQRLAGAVLFDPVGGTDLPSQLLTISDRGRRPVLAILALPDGCNAGLSSAPALHQVRLAALAAGGDGFVGVQLTEGATHIDAEGEDSGWFARWACGEPRVANVALLRRLAVRWSLDMAGGMAPQVDAAPGSQPIR